VDAARQGHGGRQVPGFAHRVKDAIEARKSKIPVEGRRIGCSAR
jgi:hypothetical protein